MIFAIILMGCAVLIDTYLIFSLMKENFDLQKDVKYMLMRFAQQDDLNEDLAVKIGRTESESKTRLNEAALALANMSNDINKVKIRVSRIEQANAKEKEDGYSEKV